jgi:hypothetical protein
MESLQVEKEGGGGEDQDHWTYLEKQNYNLVDISHML